jgi:hypothetical protein
MRAQKTTSARGATLYLEGELVPSLKAAGRSDIAKFISSEVIPNGIEGLNKLGDADKEVVMSCIQEYTQARIRKERHDSTSAEAVADVVSNLDASVQQALRAKPRCEVRSPAYFPSR